MRIKNNMLGIILIINFLAVILGMILNIEYLWFTIDIFVIIF